MEILVFKTDIKTKKRVNAIKPLFDQHPVIAKWTVDTEDVDNVLRIEAGDGLGEEDVITMIRPYGFFCEALQD